MNIYSKEKYQERQLVIFQVSGEEFGVDINEVREIIKKEDITAMPNTEEYILGIINLRGRIVVVVDLAKKLSLSRKDQTKDSRIIVVEIEGSTIGMLVDACNEVLRLRKEDIKDAPEIITQKIDQEFIEGVGIVKERLIIILDLQRSLGNKELNAIKGINELKSK